MWSYNANPQGDPVDEVRLLIGDTNPTDPLLENEEIEWSLSMYPPAEGRPAWLAAAVMVDSILMKMARQTDKSIGSLSSSASQKYDHYLFLSRQLKALWATDGKGYFDDNEGVVEAIGDSTRVVPAIPILGGGGPTDLGITTLIRGGGGL